MKKTIFLLLILSLFLISCQVPEVQEPVETIEEPEPIIEPEPVVEDIELGQICEGLLTAEEFGTICDEPSDMITLNIKKSVDGCWINIKHQKNTRLTAGLTVKDWKYEDVANQEIDRGLKMRRKDELQDVGERNYGFAEVNRDNYVWVRGTFITEIGASNDICSKEKLLEVAQAVDAKLG